MNKEEKNFYKICLLILFVVSLIQILLQVNLSELKLDLRYLALIFCGVLVRMFVNILMCSPIIAMYVGIKIAYKRYLKSKLEKIDFKNDNYYRDIIQKYSIGVISYIDSFKVEKKDIVAALLGLELKGKIKIKKTIRIIDTDEEELTESEKYIFNCLKEGRINKVNTIEYETILIQECERMNLLKTGKFSVEGFFNKRGMTLLIICLLCILLAVFGKGKFDGLIIIMMIFIIPALFFGTIIYMALNISNPYIRSKDGKILNEKLEGLRKYLKDYSSMEEKEKEELILWEDYLIYSVIFNINNKVLEEINEKLKQIKSIEN